MIKADPKVALIPKILDAYGVRYERILPPQKGYRNQSFGIVRPDGPMLNLILYKSEPDILNRIRAANTMGNYLANHGFPARKTFSDKIIRLQAARTVTGTPSFSNFSSRPRVKYGALYEYLDGRTIPWEAYTKRHIKLLGKTMSDMHAALADFRTSELPDVTVEYLAILSRIRRYFDDEAVTRGLAAKLQLGVGRMWFDRFEKLLAACKQLPHQQPLHMDFVRSNMLFNSQGQMLQLTGILDFEKSAVGHPLFDAARTLAFLLVDCKYKAEPEVSKLFLESGYNRRGAATLPRGLTVRLLDPLANLFLVYDFYKFLRHNPYESLPLNEHFVRTRDLLLQRGVVTSSTP